MPTPAADALPSELPTRYFDRVRALFIALVLTIGGTAATIEWHQGNQAKQRDDMAVARRAVDLVMGTAASTQAGLAGAGGLVGSDGTVSVAAFTAYASEVTVRSSLTSLAYEPVVPEADRATYERALGRPITDHQASGAYAPSPPRPVYYPVRVVVPATDASRAAIGFDLSGDAVRNAAAVAARDTGEVVFSAPTKAQATGATTFFVIKPLYRLGQPVATVDERRANIVGFVSSASLGTGLVGTLSAALPSGTRFQLRDGATVLAATAISTRR